MIANHALKLLTFLGILEFLVQDSKDFLQHGLGSHTIPNLKQIPKLDLFVFLKGLDQIPKLDLFVFLKGLKLKHHLFLVL